MQQRTKEKNEIWFGVILVFTRYFEILVDTGLFKYLDIGPSEDFPKVSKSLPSAFLNAPSSSTSIQKPSLTSRVLAFPFLANTPIPPVRDASSLPELSSIALKIAGEHRKIPVSHALYFLIFFPISTILLFLTITFVASSTSTSSFALML